MCASFRVVSGMPWSSPPSRRRVNQDLSSSRLTVSGGLPPPCTRPAANSLMPHRNTKFAPARRDRFIFRRQERTGVAEDGLAARVTDADRLRMIVELHHINTSQGKSELIRHSHPETAIITHAMRSLFII